jgi:hypothetical protein
MGLLRLGGLLEVMRMGGTGSLGPRPNRGGVVCEEMLILVGECLGVEETYTSEEDVAAKGVCVLTSIILDAV